ncbi:MAG: hypothetical protein HY897_26380 [Deltaproteobacteria bacterium]|nr:hypothetical protein [Deltaproteobacteria bacterium]
MTAGAPRPPVRAARRSGATVAVIAVIALVLLGTGALVAWKTLGSRGPKLPDRSAELFPLSMETYGKKFGHGEVDVSCRVRCAFAFRYAGGRAVLHYAVGANEEREAIEVQLNGRQVGFVPPAGRRLVRGLEVVLPKQYLRSGAENQLVFVNRKGQGGKAPWHVQFVWVDEGPMPQPNIDKARELRDLAYKKHGEKDVAFGNLWAALTYLRNARDYVEGYEPKPDIYDEVDRKLNDVSRELQEQFDKLMFQSRKAAQFGEKPKALDTLERALKFFPDADDARHQETRQAIEALKE